MRPFLPRAPIAVFCFATTLFVSCSKKNDSQPQNTPVAYVRLKTQFDGNQGLTWLRGYDAANCTAVVTLENSTTSSQELKCTFVATDPSGERSECTTYIDRSKLKSGLVGTYSGSDIVFTGLSYRPGGTQCDNRPYGLSGTFIITDYDAGTKKAGGSFDFSISRQANLQDCPITNRSQQGSVRSTGEFKNILFPL